MTYEEIETELDEFNGDVYFINLLTEFVWSETNKEVVGYHEQSTPSNKLIVMSTEPVNLVDTSLKDYLEAQSVTSEDVLVFCINENFYPKRAGDWVLIKIIKKVNKIRYDDARDNGAA